MKYFGECWKASTTEGAMPTTTPVGVPCSDCGRPVQNGDRGFLLPLLGGKAAHELPIHRECLFASTAGCSFQVCSCTADARTPDERFALSCEAWNRIVPKDLRTDVTGHTPWNSMKARKTLGPQIDAAAFRIGQNPELEALQARLLTLEASAAEQLAHPLLFALEPDRTELMHTASQRLFSHFSGTVAEVMLLITQAMTGTSMPMFLKPASLLGFGLLSFEDQEFKGGTTKRTWLLHFVSTAGDGWRIIRYPGIEPITLLDTAAEATDSITMSLDRMVRAATLQLEVNEADPGLHILRKALGFADE